MQNMLRAKRKKIVKDSAIVNLKAEEKQVQNSYGAEEIQVLAKQLTTCYQDLDAYFQGVWVGQEG